MYGQTHRVQSPLRSVDRQVLFTDKTSILGRWSEHFQSLFSADYVIQAPAVLRIPQQPFKAELDELSFVKEGTKAIEKQRSGRAVGVDRIPPELGKTEDQHYTVSSMNSLSVVGSWANFQMISAMQSSSPCTKTKEKSQIAPTIRGSLCSPSHVLLNRLVLTITEDHLPETQCGFRANRGTTDMVFVLRQLQEECREQNKGLYVAFVDLTKAFDTVSRKELWVIMKCLGCSPPKFLSMDIQLHKDQRGQVRLNSNLSRPFPIVNGVKQSCVLVPTLFSIFFSMMLKQVIEDLDDDGAVYICYHLDVCLFNLRRLHTHTKILEQLFCDILFTDDSALIAHTERALQHLTSCFPEAAQLFGLEVSLKKTEVLHQPAPLKDYQSPHITISGTELKAIH